MMSLSFGGTGFHSLPGLSSQNGTRGCRGKGEETDFEGIPFFFISTLKGSSLHFGDEVTGVHALAWQASPIAPEAATAKEADLGCFNL